MTRLLEPGVELTERSRTIAEYCVNAIRYWRTSDDSVVPAMTRCVEYFRRVGDRRGESLTLASLAVAQFSQEPPDVDGGGGERPPGPRASPTSSTTAFGGAMVGIMARPDLARPGPASTMPSAVRDEPGAGEPHR